MAARRGSAPVIATTGAARTVSQPSEGGSEAQTDPSLQPILDELELLRLQTQRTMKWRTLLLVPLGIGTGLLFVPLFGKDLEPFFAALLTTIAGGGLGFALAFNSPHRAFQAAYKEKVLPHLAAQFGDLSYREAVAPDYNRLVRLGLLPPFLYITAEDEIFGIYRGVRISIIETLLMNGGKNKSVVFEGFIVEIGLPRRFQATTVVVGESLAARVDKALFGRTDLQRVRLEDPEFERLYQIYSSDQVEARALLTPAMMERMMTSIGRTTEASARAA